MAKYLARRERSDGYEADDCWFDDFSAPHVPTVDDAQLQSTGLVNSDGVPLWRVSNPIGFGRKFEW